MFVWFLVGVTGIVQRRHALFLPRDWRFSLTLRGIFLSISFLRERKNTTTKSDLMKRRADVGDVLL